MRLGTFSKALLGCATAWSVFVTDPQPRRPALRDLARPSRWLGLRAAHAEDATNGFTTPTYDIQLFRPAIDSKGYVTVNASQVLGHLDFSLGLIGTWAYRPLQLVSFGGAMTPDGVSNGTRVFEVRNLITPQLQFALGLFKHFEIGVGKYFVRVRRRDAQW